VNTGTFYTFYTISDCGGITVVVCDVFSVASNKEFSGALYLFVVTGSVMGTEAL